MHHLPWHPHQSSLYLEFYLILVKYLYYRCRVIALSFHQFHLHPCSPCTPCLPKQGRNSLMRKKIKVKQINENYKKNCMYHLSVALFRTMVDDRAIIIVIKKCISTSLNNKLYNKCHYFTCKYLFWLNSISC